MGQKHYRSGMFCRDIQCTHHKALEGFSGDEYNSRKKEYCKDCNAWKFFMWLEENSWKIVMPMPAMSSKELAARIKGLDPVTAADLTEDEILCL